ncbi:MAG: radical SAM protein [Thermodesulfobacteriota bacterium]
MRYAFSKTPILKNLELIVENQGEKILFHASGTGSELFSSMLGSYFDWLNKAGPIATFNGSNVYSLYLPPIPSPAHARMVEGFIHTFILRHSTPQAATIAVTDACQCACIHCSVSAHSDSRSILSGSEIRKIIQESIALGVNNVTFTGGDPLLRSDLEDLLSCVSPEEAVTQVFTNGIELSPERARSLKASGLYGIQISLDSPFPDEHDRLRRRAGTFQAVNQGAKAALEAGLLAALSTYASNQSVQDKNLSRIAELASAWGIHEVSVFDLIPTGRLLHRDDLLLTGESRNALLEEARDLNRKYRGKPRIITQSWTNCGKGFAKTFGCLAGNYQFHVTACGDFTPCDFTPLSFGNIRSESIPRLWEKITRHPAYSKHCDSCRMQSTDFRANFIQTIPSGSPLPYLIAEVENNPFPPHFDPGSPPS